MNTVATITVRLSVQTEYNIVKVSALKVLKPQYRILGRYTFSQNLDSVETVL